jgi:hypothetical protein
VVVPGIEPGTSVSVARNSCHFTTEAVIVLKYSKIISHIPDDGRVVLKYSKIISHIPDDGRVRLKRFVEFT